MVDKNPQKNMSRGGGRGRGRGKGISFNVENLGFGRGEALPGPIQQPPPLYPIAQFKPVPLETGEERAYLLELKQELQAAMRDSVYYIQPTEKKQDIERYSDRYQAVQAQKQEWTPDWSRLPTELQPKKKRKVKFGPSPRLPKRNRSVLVDINKQFELLAEGDGDAADTAAGADADDADDADGDDKKKADDEEDAELEVYEEDELEEETDYNLTYFDNGENDDEDDDLDEGPVY